MEYNKVPSISRCMLGAALDKSKRGLTPVSSAKKAKKNQKDDDRKYGSKEEPIDLISPIKKLSFDDTVQDEEKEEISLAAKAEGGAGREEDSCRSHQELEQHDGDYGSYDELC